MRIDLSAALRAATVALLTALAIASAAPVADAATKKPHKHYAYKGGHYAGGKGSSHKGGHYKNARTGNHYTKHKSR